MEQVKGIEPSSSAWKADILAIILHLQVWEFTLPFIFDTVV